MEFLLKNLAWTTAEQNIIGDIRIRDGKIIDIDQSLTPGKGEHVLSLEGNFAYPLLVNSHDHLEMNLYPKLGRPFYQNYIEWGNDIYKPKESPIHEIESVDISDRLLWGGIKNLISGCGTVVHHNPWHRSLGAKNFPVRVLRKFAWMHSLAFGKKKIHKPFFAGSDIPFIIHIAEGIDAVAAAEIGELNKLHLLKPNTVLIHAVNPGQHGLELISKARPSVVWCPASNLYLFGQTSPINQIKNQNRIVLGTDSTLTGSSSLLEEAAVAYRTGFASAKEIFSMLTSVPATIFSMRTSQIKMGQPVGLFVAPIKKTDYFENLLSLLPGDLKMIFVDGALRLSEFKVAGLPKRITVSGNEKFTDIDVPMLLRKIEKKVPSEFLEQNALWRMIRS